MKKLFALIIIIVTILSLNFFNEHTLQEIFGNDIVNYYAFVNDYELVSPIENVSIIANGKGAILKTDNKNSFKLLSSLSSVSGECVELKNSGLTYIKNKLNLKINSIYNVNNYKVINGYSNKLDSFLLDDGKKLNVQIAISDDKVLIGYPIILQGF